MSTSRIAIRRIAALSGPRVQASIVGARPFTSLGETLSSRERAEEARYIRLREKAAMEARIEAAKGDKDLEDAMHDAAGIIAATHDKMSQEGLLNLAKWKLGRLS